MKVILKLLTVVLGAALLIGGLFGVAYLMVINGASEESQAIMAWSFVPVGIIFGLVIAYIFEWIDRL